MAALFDFLPLWLALPLLLALCALGLIVAAAAFQASVMLAEAAWHGSLHMTTALTLVFARAGLLTFQWCGMAVLGTAQFLWAMARMAWAHTAERLQAALAVRMRAIRQRARLRDTWQSEFKDEFATFDEFLYAFEHGGKRREERGEPRFDDAPPPKPPPERPRPSPSPPPSPPPPPPPDPRQVAYRAACRVLGLPESGFTRQQLITRHRALIQAAHPDKGGSHERAAALNAARDLIKHMKGWT